MKNFRRNNLVIQKSSKKDIIANSLAFSVFRGEILAGKTGARLYDGLRREARLEAQGLAGKGRRGLVGYHIVSAFSAKDILFFVHAEIIIQGK